MLVLLNAVKPELRQTFTQRLDEHDFIDDVQAPKKLFSLLIITSTDWKI